MGHFRPIRLVLPAGSCLVVLGRALDELSLVLKELSAKIATSFDELNAADKLGVAVGAVSGKLSETIQAGDTTALVHVLQALGLVLESMGGRITSALASCRWPARLAPS